LHLTRQYLIVTMLRWRPGNGRIATSTNAWQC
jgi:hypothetical protein